MTSLSSLVAQGAGGGNATFLISLVLLVAIFYFLLIRPQQRRVRQQRALVESLTLGDEVITIGGIYGRIVDMDDETVMLDLSPGTRVRFVKNAVARRLVAEEPDLGGEAGQA